MNIDFSKTIAIISHKNPDLDTTSSALVFYKILKNIDNKKVIDLICIDKIPKKFDFIGNI